jgi:hypothetical protein
MRLTDIAETEKGPGVWAKPNWDKWKLVPRLELWQAVALACDIDPTELEKSVRRRPGEPGVFYERLTLALANAGETFEMHPDPRFCGHRLWGPFAAALAEPPHSTMDAQMSFHHVRTKAFAVWASSAWELPEGFPRPPAAPSPAEADADARPLGKRERRKHMTVIAALALRQGIDLDRPSQAAQSLEKALGLIGRQIPVRTLQDVVNEAKRALSGED